MSFSRVTFLCPAGTTFHQRILACDFWYNSDCSLAEEDYGANQLIGREGPGGRREEELEGYGRAEGYGSSGTIALTTPPTPPRYRG